MTWAQTAAAEPGAATEESPAFRAQRRAWAWSPFAAGCPSAPAVDQCSVGAGEGGRTAPQGDRAPGERRKALKTSANDSQSQPSGMIDKLPRHIEPLRQLGRESFHPERLGRVMTAEEKIDPQLLRRDRRPVRRFARDVGVDALPRGGINFPAR